MQSNIIVTAVVVIYLLVMLLIGYLSSKKIESNTDFVVAGRRLGPFLMAGTLAATEIGGGSVRIHQNDVQEKMFEMLGFTKEQAHERFGFLLDAFKYGVPPHAGLAYGLDRLVMLMAKEDSIRDVIAFPKVKDASCLMTEAPSPVDAAQLEELGLEVEPQAEEETTEE